MQKLPGNLYPLTGKMPCTPGEIRLLDPMQADEAASTTFALYELLLFVFSFSQKFKQWVGISHDLYVDRVSETLLVAVANVDPDGSRRERVAGRLGLSLPRPPAPPEGKRTNSLKQRAFKSTTTAIRRALEEAIKLGYLRAEKREKASGRKKVRTVKRVDVYFPTPKMIEFLKSLEAPSLPPAV